MKRQDNKLGCMSSSYTVQQSFGTALVFCLKDEQQRINRGKRVNLWKAWMTTLKLICCPQGVGTEYRATCMMTSHNGLVEDLI